jgi:ABC-2 type transport system permease protein
MSRFRALLKAGLKSNFGLSLLMYRVVKQKKDIWLVPLVILAVFGLAPLLYYYLKFIEFTYRLLEPLGQQSAILTLGILAGQLFILVFGLFYIISAFYFSRDLEILIPLPVRPFQVMLSKFGVILTNEYMTVALLVLPILVYFGILAKAGPAYWLKAALVYLFLPVIPLAIVSIVVIILMRFVNLGRKKDLLIIVGSILLIIIGMSAQFWLNRSTDLEPNSEAVIKFFSSSDSLLHRVGSRFPPSIWATKALAGGFSRAAGGNLLLFAGVSLILLLGMTAGAEALFYRGLVGLGETSRRGRTLSRADISRRVSSGRPAVLTIFQREWRIMNRTPIFLLNGILTVVLIPAVFLVMAAARSGDSDLTALLSLLSSKNAFAVILASAAFMTICGSLNGTSSSAFSREGSQFWMSKVIPVLPREQVAAKFLHSYLVALLGIAAATVVLVWQFRLKFGILAAATGLALGAAFVLTAVGLAIDLARPLLDWINPQKAIKQNLNVLIALLADLGILALLGLMCRILGRLGLAGSAILVVLGLVLLGLSAAAWLFLAKFAEKRYTAIEV